MDVTKQTVETDEKKKDTSGMHHEGGRPEVDMGASIMLKLETIDGTVRRLDATSYDVHQGLQNLEARTMVQLERAHAEATHYRNESEARGRLLKGAQLVNAGTARLAIGVAIVGVGITLTTWAVRKIGVKYPTTFRVLPAPEA